LRLIGILAFFVCAACNPFASYRSLSAFEGRLVGTDRGEFGGELVFRARDGSIQSVLKDNVQGIFKMPFGLVVFAGLDYRYKRQVCRVWVRPIDCRGCGKTLELGHAQSSAGMAWWYREYAKEQSAEDRGRYESAEQDARLRKRGIWSMSKPLRRGSGTNVMEKSSKLLMQRAD